MSFSSASVEATGQEVASCIQSSFSDISEDHLICCGGRHCKKTDRQKRHTLGMREADIICEGTLEKKIDRRRFSLGPAWKRKYCILSSEALHIYRSKTSRTNPSRTIPLCHMKDIKRLSEDNENKVFHFDVSTEQGEILTFRCRHDKGWAAQIQIQMIFYKNRQDILRYKQIVSTMTVSDNLNTKRQPDVITSNNNKIIPPDDVEKLKNIECPKGCKALVLPFSENSSVGIGITVIPLPDGRVVVNRVLDGGPALKMGNIRPHDQILSANGHPVTSVEMLSEVVRNSVGSVILVIKPRIAKSSPIIDDPKALLIEESNNRTNCIQPNCQVKGLSRSSRMPNASPKHFRFT